MVTVERGKGEKEGRERGQVRFSLQPTAAGVASPHGQADSISGGAVDGDERSPGPILLKGDHGPTDFRNLRLTPAGVE
jgi:hypothetical protein